ncbi:MAG: hypothetical protein U0625_08255 [Phycisphaerales bacterium]
MRRTGESILWGLFCTSSWTWCIGMYLPFILLRLWGWPGFWAFFIPNVLGCTAFGFVLDRERSQALMRRLGWTCALFSAVTVAYQAYFAGWAAQYFVVGGGTLATVAATGVPAAMLLAGGALALRGGALRSRLLPVLALRHAQALRPALAMRGDAFWCALGAVAAVVSGVLLLLPRSVPALDPGGELTARMSDAAAATTEQGALVGLGALGFALPTIAAGFLLSPYFDLTFHRAAQEAPQPRVAFATFGLTFAAMLLGVASCYDPQTGGPAITWPLVAVWGLQLFFTMSVHLRELLLAESAVRIPAAAALGPMALAVLLATPAFLFTLGPSVPAERGLVGGSLHALLPGEPIYLCFLGAYGLLFPVLAILEPRGLPRRALLAVLGVGLPCYLLGAYGFQTALMPVPILAALAIAAWPGARRMA